MTDFERYLNKFISNLQDDVHARYKSYEHCRRFFLENKNDETKYELIALHLYAYLASWGMLRNSFLMQKDYLFNVPVVEILCKEKYAGLASFSPYDDECMGQVKLMIELRDEIRAYYLSQNYIKDGSNEVVQITRVSDTLITKIMLGTFGCVPAYDQYFVKAVRMEGINGIFNEKSIIAVIEFAKKNKELILSSSNRLGELYSPMKVIDMYFWEKGISGVI